MTCSGAVWCFRFVKLREERSLHCLSMVVHLCVNRVGLENR